MSWPFVSVAIMHADWKADRVASVQNILQGLRHSYVRVIKATPGAGVWDTAQKAWQAYPEGATHHIVLQDDIQLCQFFWQNAMSAIVSRPDHVLSFFCLRKPPMEKAKAAASSWCWGMDAAYGPASAMPTHQIPNMLEWQKKFVKPEYDHDDNRIGLYARATGQGVWVTAPSLVQHGSCKSSLGHQWAGQAGWFHDQVSVVNWHCGLQNLDAVPVISATVPYSRALIDPDSAKHWRKAVKQ